MPATAAVNPPFGWLTLVRTVRDVVRNYSFVATVVEVDTIEPVITRDPDDDAVLALAVFSESEVIVSGDDDLLELRQYCMIRILTATELLAELYM